MNPKPVTDLNIAFPANVEDLLPKEIPDTFKRDTGNTWYSFQKEWFFNGIKNLSVEPKEGIDIVLAVRHLSCIQTTFSLKHEVKATAVAYLASLWFDSWKKEE